MEPGTSAECSSHKTGAQNPLWAKALPLLLTVAIFAVIFWRIPFGEFWEALGRARLLPFLTLMGSFSLCFFLVDTFVLSRAIRWFHGPLPYRTLLPVRAVTYLVSIINTQLAQGALALYIYRRFGTPLGQIASTVALLILLEATNLVLFATVGAIAFPGGTPGALLTLPLALAAIWLAVMGLARGRWCVLGRALPDHVLLSTFKRAGPRHCATLLSIKASVFFLALLVHGQALAFFDIAIPMSRLLTFLPVVFLVAALPVTVAHLGTSQAAWLFFFGAYAAEADLLAYSLVSHLTFMLANGTFGVIFLPRAYGDLFRGSRARRDSTPAQQEKQSVEK